jgi:hypothetical protein
MSEPFHIAVLNRANGQTIIDHFATAYRAKQRVDQINAEKDELTAEYMGDSRDRKYIKTSARVREVFAETMREIELTKRNTMSTAQHTPAPWEYREQGDADEFVMLTHDGKWIIAFRQNGELMTATQRANAKLMAASPKLLEALRMADQRITELCKMVCHLSDNPRKVRAEDYAEEVRAAIAGVQA